MSKSLTFNDPGPAARRATHRRAALLQGDVPPASAAVPLTPAVEGLPLTVYGASYEGANVNNTATATRYVERSARRLGMTLTNRGVSGFEAVDVAMHMMQQASPGPLAAGTRGVVLLPALLNDVLRTPQATERRETFKQNLKACVYRAMCKSLVFSTDAGIVQAPAASWTQQSIAAAAGYTMAFKSTTADGAAITLPAQTSQDLVLFSYALATLKPAGAGGTPYANRGPKFSVDVDGTRKVDHKTPYNSVDTKSPTGWSAGYLATPLFGLANAAHTVVMTNHQDVPTSSLQAFDSLGVIDRTYLPQVVVNRGVKFDPARPPSGGTNADVDTFRGYFDEMVAEISAEAPWMLPAISYFDPLDYGWDPAAMIGSDNLHPNDLGHATLADALTAHLASLPFRAGMNK